MTAKQSLMVVTAQALSLLYYGSAVWLTPGLKKANLKTVESLHYRCVRLVVRDYRKRISREVIDKVTKRLPPRLWIEYSICSLYINARMCNYPPKLLNEVSSNLYTQRRQEGRLYGYNSARCRATNQRTRNWIGPVLNKITTPWTNMTTLSKDQIRIMLKKTPLPCRLVLNDEKT